MDALDYDLHLSIVINAFSIPCCPSALAFPFKRLGGMRSPWVIDPSLDAMRPMARMVSASQRRATCIWGLRHGTPQCSKDGNAILNAPASGLLLLGIVKKPQSCCPQAGESIHPQTRYQFSHSGGRITRTIPVDKLWLVFAFEASTTLYNWQVSHRTIGITSLKSSRPSVYCASKTVE